MARLCGTSCGPGDVLAVAPNGTCLLCNTGVQAASFMRTCGTCPPFASVRLAANSSCYECLSISPNNILVGGGEVHAAARANDTFIYSTLPTFMSDPAVVTNGLTMYTYVSGTYKISVYPADYPGNTLNLTLYQLDAAMNILYSHLSGGPTTQAYVQFDFHPLIPDWVLSSDISKLVFSPTASCQSLPNELVSWVAFTSDPWLSYISINAENPAGNSKCYLTYSVFWANG